MGQGGTNNKEKRFMAVKEGRVQFQAAWVVPIDADRLICGSLSEEKCYPLIVIQFNNLQLIDIIFMIGRDERI